MKANFSVFSVVNLFFSSAAVNAAGTALIFTGNPPRNSPSASV